MKLRDPRVRLLALLPTLGAAATGLYLMETSVFTRWYAPDDPVSPGSYCQVEAVDPGEPRGYPVGCPGNKLGNARAILGSDKDLVVPRNFEIESTTTMRKRFKETRTVLLVAVNREAFALFVVIICTPISVFLLASLWATLRAMIIARLRHRRLARAVILWASRKKKRPRKGRSGV